MEKKYKIGMDVAIAVTALGFLANFVGIVSAPGIALTPMVDTILFVLVGYYAVWGYKKPHGNLLRYVMLIFALSQVSIFLENIDIGGNVVLAMMAVNISLITYVAGRLNKIQKNKYIMVVILLIYIAFGIIPILGPGNGQAIPNPFLYIALFDRAFLWTAICSAYFTRFLQHKEAGLED